jgi:hypothetical protein
MLNAAFDGVGANGPDFYPTALRPAIDTINDRVYEAGLEEVVGRLRSRRPIVVGEIGTASGAAGKLSRPLPP